MKKLLILPLALALMAPGPPKVTICHVLDDPPVTMDVPLPALSAHLGHGDYLGACVAPVEPPPAPAPPGARPLFKMWLIRGVVTDQPFDPNYMRWQRMNYCILISDTHPSVDQQVRKCFPPYGWYPLGAPCAGPVYDNDTWACDDELEKNGWSRLPLSELCRRYPSWCGR